MKIEIEFAGDVDATDVKEFMQRLYEVVSNFEWVFKEIRVVKEPKQTE